MCSCYSWNLLSRFQSYEFRYPFIFSAYSVPTLKRRLFEFGIRYYRKENPADVMRAVQVRSSYNIGMKLGHTGLDISLLIMFHTYQFILNSPLFVVNLVKLYVISSNNIQSINQSINQSISQSVNHRMLAIT